MNQMHSSQRLIDKGQIQKLLEVQHLNAWYGAAHILHGVNLNVGRGEVVALMGRTGAGKSTTLKSIAALVPRREGQMDFMGESIAKKASHQIAQRGLGYVPEDRRIFTELTVLENLEVGRQKQRQWPDGAAVPHWTPEKLFALFPNLGEMPDRLGGRMSGGEQQMLSVARTLMGQPYLVLLDEPSEGVAPLIVEQMARTILELKAQGIGILLSEQNLPFAEVVADRAYVLEKGQIVHQASMAELSAAAAVRKQSLDLTALLSDRFERLKILRASAPGIFCAQRADLQPDELNNISKKMARFFMVKHHEITSLLRMVAYSTTTGLNSGGAPK